MKTLGKIVRYKNVNIHVHVCMICMSIIRKEKKDIEIEKVITSTNVYMGLCKEYLL